VTKTTTTTPVAQVVSKRDPTKVWTVKRHLKTGVLSCDCPAWIFKPMCGGGGGGCTRQLEKVARPDGTKAWRCFVHGEVNPEGGSDATRACKHIAAYTNELANPALKGKVQNIDLGAGVDLVEPEVGAALSALLWSADRAGVRDRLFERQWKDVARHLSLKVGELKVERAAAFQAGFDFRGVRQIVLED
jgi:hypothetical protein